MHRSTKGHDFSRAKNRSTARSASTLPEARKKHEHFWRHLWHHPTPAVRQRAGVPFDATDLSTAAAVGSIATDTYQTAKAIGQCHQ